VAKYKLTINDEAGVGAQYSCQRRILGTLAGELFTDRVGGFSAKGHAHGVDTEIRYSFFTAA
jgi:hypothetical protein